MGVLLVSGQSLSQSGSGSAITGHFNNTVVAGDTIIVAAEVLDATSTNGLSGVTDSAGSTYVKAGSYFANGTIVELWVSWSCLTTGSPTQTITATCKVSSDAVSIVAQEFSGLSGGSYDTSVGVSSLSQSLTTPTLTPAVSGELLLLVGAQNNTNRLFTVSAPFTQIANTSNLAMAYDIYASTTGLTGTEQLDQSGITWDLVMFALKPTSGGTIPSAGQFFQFF